MEDEDLAVRFDDHWRAPPFFETTQGDHVK